MPAIRAPKLEDFGGPKKYRSAFFIFSDTKRDAIVNELKAKAEASGEKFNVAQVATTLGEMWKAISAEEKKPLEEQSAAEKAAWQPKHDAWIQTEEYAKFKQLQKDAVADKKGRKAKTAAKKSGMPKKPASLFMYINGSAEVQGKVKAECEKMAAAGTKVEMKHRAGLAKKFHDEIVADETLKAEWNTKFEAAKAQYEIDQKEWLASEAGQAFTKSKDDAAKLLKKQCREKLFAAGYPANVTGGA